MRTGLIFCLAMSWNLSAYSQDATGDTTQAKRLTPNAIATIDQKDFNQGVIHSPYQLFNGRLTGIGMSGIGNDPNGEFMIRVRGLSTFQNETHPLIVVDGFITNNLLIVDPNDIARITVLKDAAASSIYGVQGGNGVLLITTKKSNSEMPSVSFSTTLGLEKPLFNIAPVPDWEYMRYPGAIQMGGSSDWLDLITQNGISSINNLAVSAGSKSFSIRGSVNYRKANGTLIGTGFDQINSRINLQQKALKDRLLVQLTIAATSRKSDYGFREAIKYAFTANPTMPVMDPTSTLYGGYRQNLVYDNYNPVAIIEQNTNAGNEGTMSMGFNGDYQFDGNLNGLAARFSYQLQNQDNLYGRYYAKNSYYTGLNRNGLANRTSQKQNAQQLATTLSYQRKLKHVDFHISSGYQSQYYFNESFLMEGGNFLTDAFTYNNMSAAQDFPNGLGQVASSADSYKVISWLSTASITFNGKYFFNATSNYNGSTRLGENNKWGLFPSIGGGILWEKGLPFISSLKLRIAWGKSGNIPHQSNLSGSVMSPGGNSFVNGNYVPYYLMTRDGNPDLKWEEKSELNMGTDFTFLNERISGSLDWFTNKVTDLISLINAPSPPTLSGLVFANLGELQNRGVEINLNIAAVKKSEFSWDFNFNLSRVSTKVNSLSGNGYTLAADGKIITGSLFGPGSGSYGVNLIQEGSPLGQLYGPVYNGIESGLATYKDLNGDNYYCGCPDDFKVLGNALPKFNFGWGNQLSYKNLELKLLFRGASGHQTINTYRLFHESTESVRYSNLVKTSYFNPDLKYASFSNLFVENASFVKLDNISLAYHIPSTWRLTLTATAQNLFTISKYTGMDPEVEYGNPIQKGQTINPINQSPLISGIELRGNYLPSRIFSLGVSLKL